MPYKEKSKRLACARRSYHKGRLNDAGFLNAHSARQLKYNKDHPERYLCQSAKNRARRKNLPFNLEYSDIIIPEVCPIFNKPFIYGTQYAASLDRIIPELGYIKDNIQVISIKANTMKNNASSEELKEFSNWVLSQYTS